MKKIICCLLLIASFGTVYGQNMKLQFNSEGKFKIIQFTDLHYCMQSEQSRANAQNSLDVIQAVLDLEKPDLVVFTGDIITCNPIEKSWNELLEVVIARRIPYAVTIGNHDDEPEWSREQIAVYLEKKPYSLFKRGPKNIKGEGNFVLEVAGNDGKTAALLYMMDSNAYNEAYGQKGYDWFDFNQVDWYRKTSSAFKKKNQGKPYPALAFFHIPLQEYYFLVDPVNTDMRYTGKGKPVLRMIGERQEKECPGIVNTGMFAAMVEAGDVMGTFVGHDHSNNYIGLVDGIALAYGCFTGSHQKYTGARIIEMKENQHSFDTYIRRVYKGKSSSTVSESLEYKVTYPDSFVSSTH
jgi:3',5'-cyclic AMP phosphodiesterase CpdA